MTVDDSSRFSAITTCGYVKTNFSYNGTYAFIYQFGGASIYVYKNQYKHVWQVYSRSWFPPKELCDVKKIHHDRGFLLVETKDDSHDSFRQIVCAYHTLVGLAQLEFQPHIDEFSSSLFTNDDTLNLFQDQTPSLTALYRRKHEMY